ncbi:hypothetical protein PFISCL1PPCAC_6632, partial [Pristionchus fissidentatus]
INFSPLSFSIAPPSLVECDSTRERERGSLKSLSLLFSSPFSSLGRLSVISMTLPPDVPTPDPIPNPVGAAQPKGGSDEDQREGLLSAEERDLDDDHWDEDGSTESDVATGIRRGRTETMTQFLNRQYQNIVHFFVEDWFLSALLGIITAILSIGVDVAIEYLLHMRLHMFEYLNEVSIYSGFCYWVLHIGVCVTFAALFCSLVSKQAVGSGIPEVKVIISGFVLKNYLSMKTLIAKVIGLVFTLGGGLPVGKEGPFVHMGAIVASLLTKATTACRYNQFFSNEGREMEMLSSGCAVGIACTFSAPAGGVLYGIESTSKYFAVKNYWRSFFATTCSALVFRFAMAAIVPPHIGGTITAYYQTSFPNEVFLVEEIPLFVLLGVMCGLAGALFILVHRKIATFMKTNRLFLAVFGKSPVAFTALVACFVGVVTYPEGIGRYIAGKLTFRETLADFVANCSFVLSNDTGTGCNPSLIAHWTGGDGSIHPLITLTCYLLVYFFIVAQCISLHIPAGIFVPSFVMGACGGRIMGEALAMWFPEGIRGAGNPQIYPGLYAVVGAAAYTGAVTHSLSIAVIVCETTGQLCALLPVLIALMIANAICSFLQPSIYESIILLKNLPFLTDLPPSRISVHTLKVEKVMVKELYFISRNTTYKELRDLVIATPQLRSYPFVTDKESMCLLGSVSRRYLVYLLYNKLGHDPALHNDKRRSRTASELLSTIHSFRRQSSHATGLGQQASNPNYLTDRNISGNTLLAHSPLHDAGSHHRVLAPLLSRQTEPHLDLPPQSVMERATILASCVLIDDAAIDPAPFQLVNGTSLFKVHTLFSLLGLNHAYVTERGRLVGVVSLKELRETFANIYLRGALPIQRRSMAPPVEHSSESGSSA